MTDYGKRVYEMLVRVLVFWQNYRDLIGKDSNADQLFQKVDAAFKRIAVQSTEQASSKTAVRTSSGDRTTARDALRKQI